MEDNIKNLIKNIKDNGCKFISFEYTNAQEEKARYTLQTGFDYLETVKKSLLELETESADDQTTFQAIEALKESFTKTINNQQDKYTKEGMYHSFEFNGETIKGLKIDMQSGKIYLNGLVQSKTILEEGKEKKRSISKNPVIARKNEIKKSLPVSKFREFKIDINSLSKAKINGQTITF